MPISCKKNKLEYKFGGQIVGSLTGAPVSGVTVILSQKVLTNGVVLDYMFAGSDNTDSNGSFDITIDREKATAFLLKFEKDNYFPLIIEETSANVTTDEVNLYNKKLEPLSWVTFKIKNFFPTDDDHFRFITHTFREGCDGCAVNSSINYYGELDTTFTYLTTPGEYVKFTYINVTTGFSKYDSVYTAPFENFVYEIEY